MLLLTRWVATAGLITGLGILVGIGLAATTYVVVLGALVQLVSPRQRGIVFGIITAMGSAGFLVMPPVAQWLVDNYGWQQALRIEAVLILSVVLLAFGLPGRQKKGRETPAGRVMEPEVPLWSFVREGFTKPSYLLLVSGFVVCGFHIAFIGTHLPVYLEDNGIGHIRGAALAFIGAFNLVGSLTFGWLADRLPRRFLLSFIYGMRGVVLLIYLLTPITVASTLLFSGAMGPPVAGHGARDQRHDCPAVRPQVPGRHVRLRVLQPSGRRLLRRLVVRPGVRRDRFLRPWVLRCHRPGVVRLAGALADPGKTD